MQGDESEDRTLQALRDSGDQVFQRVNSVLEEFGIEGTVAYMMVAGPEQDERAPTALAKRLEQVFTSPDPQIAVAGCWWCKDERGQWTRCCIA